jgi:hypothetical protein
VAEDRGTVVGSYEKCSELFGFIKLGGGGKEEDLLAS